MPRERSTSTDVARRAGVSRATVSYVLNGRADQSIPEATRQRVLTAAHELGYVPNAASRALRGGRSHLVVLVNSGMPWSTNITDVEDRLTADVAASGRSLVVWRRPGPDDLAATLANLEPCILIALDPLSAAEREVLATVGVPLVEADPGHPGTDPSPRVQAERLVGGGHSRLGYLTTSEPSLRRFAEPRTAGFREACRSLGLPEPRVGEVLGGLAASVPAVADVLAGWLTGPEPVTAVACFNDVHAAACVAAADGLGVAVPNALSVIGLDDEVFAPFIRPPLTTVRLDPLGFADDLWARCLHRLGEGGEPGAFVPSVRLVERASVGVAQGSRETA
ncbi:MAG: LacI family DNA-binding transcriptional regulator [Propionicimonas sp.]|uniref:LacI family DNA-binding transcriptional regulator n=1 Tax=Propionicimonas sp. TaxID=1955623 RepID=UPI003D0F2B06